MKALTKHTTNNYLPIVYNDETFALYSYHTYICHININEHTITLSSYYDYSNTTKRHLRWFFEDTMEWSIGVNDIRRALKEHSLINGYAVKMLS